METNQRTSAETRAALHEDLRRWREDSAPARDIKDRCFYATPALLDDADALAGALAEVVRQREIIRQARRHVQVILKQTDAGLMEMRAALGNAIGPGEGPLRGVRGNLLALFDNLDRAALAPHDAADLLRKLAAMAPNRPLGARGAGATATDTSGPNTGALGA